MISLDRAHLIEEHIAEVDGLILALADLRLDLRTGGFRAYADGRTVLVEQLKLYSLCLEALHQREMRTHSDFMSAPIRERR